MWPLPVINGWAIGWPHPTPCNLVKQVLNLPQRMVVGCGLDQLLELATPPAMP